MSKKVLVTGTSTGFGKLIAVTLAKEGYSVVATMRHVGTHNGSVAAELHKLSNVEVIDMDVTNTTSVNVAIEKTLTKYGQIDVLVNNAGIAAVGLLEATSIEQMKSIFEVNLWGYIRTIQAVLPAMRTQKSGLIINLSSSFGILSVPYMAPYVGTKYAIEGMTESLQYEVKKYGIEAVTVMPGPFPTEIARRSKSADRPEIVSAYGEAETGKIQQFGAMMYAKMMEHQMDNQEVADAVKKVIGLAAGTRPAQTLVSRIGGGIEQEFADSKTAVKKKWMQRSGFGNFM